VRNNEIIATVTDLSGTYDDETLVRNKTYNY